MVARAHVWQGSSPEFVGAEEVRTQVVRQLLQRSPLRRILACDANTHFSQHVTPSLIPRKDVHTHSAIASQWLVAEDESTAVVTIATSGAFTLSQLNTTSVKTVEP